MEFRRRFLLLLSLVLGILSAANTQEAVISLDAVMLGVVEGEIARVCIDINDENLLDTENPPTVEIATEESETGPDFIPLFEVVALVQTEERICFDIPTVDDDVVEPSESIVVRLSNPERVTIGNAQVEIFITNDGDLISLDFFNEDTTVMEGVVLDVCVIITNGSNQLPNLVTAEIVAFPFSLSDYILLDGTITVPVGANTGDTLCKGVSILLDGELGEADEMFSLSLRPDGAGSADVADTIKTVTIIDADRGAVVIEEVSVIEADTMVEIVIGLAPNLILLLRDVGYTVTLTDGTAEAGLDYQNQATPSEITFASGSNVDNTMSVMIPINDDVLNEADETIIISLIANNPELDDGLSELIYIIDNDPKCEQLSNISNGTVSVSGFYNGATATYTCAYEYKLFGVDTRTCGEGTAWSGAEPFCVLRVCDDPPVLNKGSYTVDDMGLVVGTVAIYSCNAGYEFMTNYTTRKCLVNETWSTDDIECVLVRVCDDPPVLNKGSYTVDDMGLVVGTVAIYSCDAGYEFRTNYTTRKCLVNETWSTEDIECVLDSPTTVEPRIDDDDDDDLSAGAIAGIVIAALVIVAVIIALVILLIICLILRRRNRSGNYKPSYETQDAPTKIQKTDIGEPVLPEDPEPANTVAESDLTQSNEMLIN